MVDGVEDVELAYADEWSNTPFYTSWGSALAVILDKMSWSKIAETKNIEEQQIDAYILFPHNVLVGQRLTGKQIRDWRKAERNPPIIFASRKPYIPTGDFETNTT